ncbi:hypothetical protein BGX34_005366 [Mortierella sp. NVP85]|nr:hypothetical protein BGX34_005366 [Mortierella sp. NVP85]
MPGPTDKIFLPVSIFVLNIVLAIFKFVLVSSVGACFIIYSRYGGEYASSVRWIRSAGYLSIIRTLESSNTRRKIPGSVRWALIVGFFATLIASFLDKGIAGFINPATSSGPPTRAFIVSPQFAPFVDHKMFLGWNSIVTGNVEETINKTLISPLAIANPTNGSVYTPVVSDYTLTCTEFNVKLQGQTVRNTTGCATIYLDLSQSNEAGQFIKTDRSPNRWSIVMASSSPGPNSFTMFNQVLVASLGLEAPNTPGNVPKVGCPLQESYRLRRAQDIIDGVTAFPTTSTKNCLYDTGDISTVAMTTVRYTLFTQLYKPDLINAFFDNSKSDDLLLAMSEATKTRAMPSPAGNTAIEVWVELRMNGSTIDILACGSGGPPSQTQGQYEQSGFECLYGSVSVLQVKKTPNEKLLEAIDRKLINRGLSTFMTLEYATEMQLSTDSAGAGKAAPLSMEQLRLNTMTVAKSMARLGFSFYPDYDNGRLYIEYDIAVVNAGLEVPLWVLILAGIIAVISFVVWQSATWLIGSPYHNTLYSIVSDELASKSNTPIPKVMRLRFQPLMIEDVKLFPDQVEPFPSKAEVLPEDVKSI